MLSRNLPGGITHVRHFMRPVVRARCFGKSPQKLPRRRDGAVEVQAVQHCHLLFYNFFAPISVIGDVDKVFHGRRIDLLVFSKAGPRYQGNRPETERAKGLTSQSAWP
eukprot:SAG11_NODE_85_length_17370_cov_29.272017_11_plen_108_part_00